jgi:hypothetical protein
VALFVQSESGRILRRFRREAEVGECVLGVQPEDESRHLAASDVEEACSLRPHLPELQSTRLAAPAAANEDEDTLVVELAELVRLLAELLPGAQPLARALGHAGQTGPGAG